jgi:hypothetical protein
LVQKNYVNEIVVKFKINCFHIEKKKERSKSIAIPRWSSRPIEFWIKIMLRAPYWALYNYVSDAWQYKLYYFLQDGMHVEFVCFNELCSWFGNSSLRLQCTMHHAPCMANCQIGKWQCCSRRKTSTFRNPLHF